MKFITLLSLSLVTTSALAHYKVVYGEDNRHEVNGYRSLDIAALASSTVALVKSEKITQVGEQFVLDGASFAEKMNMCAEERFAKQPAPAHCSGFLVGENRIMTAGHCVATTGACEKLRFVFDFHATSDSTAQLTFNADQIYSCKKVLGWKKENKGPDFAIVELDRPVVGRTPLRLSDNRSLKRKTDLLVIGHPAGLPTKITDEAQVRKIVGEKGFFMANLDTYGGNSGSAVFNARTLEVEGILVRGEEDYKTDEARDCRVSNYVSNTGGRGEDVTLISVVQENNDFEVANAPRIIFEYRIDTDSGTCGMYVGQELIMEVDPTFCTSAALLK